MAARHAKPDVTADDVATKTADTSDDTTASDTATTDVGVIKSSLPYAGFVHSKGKRDG